MQKYDLEDLQAKSLKGASIADLAREYGVSRQRMYQVFQRNSLTTPDRKKHGYAKTLSPKQLWLWKTLSSKHIDRQELYNLADTLELPDVCPVLGIPLNYNDTGYREDDRPSVDQIIPSGGYKVGNVVVVSWRANRIKNDGNPEEHLKIYEYYSKRSCN